MLANLTTSANVSTGALYDHFRSKQELARAVIEAGSARFTSARSPFRTARSTPRSRHRSAARGSHSILAVNDVTVQAVFRLITEIPDQPGTDPTLLATRVADYQPLMSAVPSRKAIFATTTPTRSPRSWWKPSPGCTYRLRSPADHMSCPPARPRPGTCFCSARSTEPHSTTS